MTAPEIQTGGNGWLCTSGVGRNSLLLNRRKMILRVDVVPNLKVPVQSAVVGQTRLTKLFLQPQKGDPGSIQDQDPGLELVLVAVGPLRHGVEDQRNTTGTEPDLGPGHDPGQGPEQDQNPRIDRGVDPASMTCPVISPNVHPPLWLELDLNIELLYHFLVICEAFCKEDNCLMHKGFLSENRYCFALTSFL